MRSKGDSDSGERFGVSMGTSRGRSKEGSSDDVGTPFETVLKIQKGGPSDRKMGNSQKLMCVFCFSP